MSSWIHGQLTKLKSHMHLTSINDMFKVQFPRTYSKSFEEILICRPYECPDLWYGSFIFSWATEYHAHYFSAKNCPWSNN